jgi:hypothetical protein
VRRHLADTRIERLGELVPSDELKFSLSVKRFGSNPAIEPRHFVGSRKERLGRDRIPPVEDLASDHTQQDDQQQTGSNAKGGEESDSHNASFTFDVQVAGK